MKDAMEITEVLRDKIFDDIFPASDGIKPCSILLYCKDLSYQEHQTGILKWNPLALIIVSYDTSYVVNNELRFKKLEIVSHEDHDEYIFKRLKENNKWFQFSYYIRK